MHIILCIVFLDNTQLEPANLLHMEWHESSQQQRQELRIVNKVSHEWRKIGIMKAAVLGSPTGADCCGDGSTSQQAPICCI